MFLKNFEFNSLVLVIGLIYNLCIISDAVYIKKTAHEILFSQVCKISFQCSVFSINSTVIYIIVTTRQILLQLTNYTYSQIDQLNKLVSQLASYNTRKQNLLKTVRYLPRYLAYEMAGKTSKKLDIQNRQDVIEADIVDK